MAKESPKEVSKAGKAMHSKDPVKRSLAGEVLRQAQKTGKTGTKKSGK